MQQVIWVKAGAVLFASENGYNEDVTRRGAAQCLRQWREFGFEVRRSTIMNFRNWNGEPKIQRRYIVETETQAAALDTFNFRVEERVTT